MDLRLLATADLHLGMRFAGYPEVQAELAEARFSALERLVARANADECRLLLVAGDLFDRAAPPQRDILRAADALKEFQGELAAVLPGNHDFHAGHSSTLWRAFQERAGDRVLVLAEPRVHDLRHYGLEALLYPGPCTSKHSPAHALSWLSPAERPRRQTEPGVLHLGVAHGAIEGISPDAQGEYYRMRTAELEGLGLDLWVVGHTHRPHPIQEEAGGAFLFIPGTPEPDGFDCRHGGSAWILSLGRDRRVRAQSLQTGTYRFRREALELEEGSDPAQSLERFRSPEYARSLLRLSLKGRLAREELRQLRLELDALSRSFLRLEVDDSELAERITSELVRSEFSEGSFPSLLLEDLMAEGDPEALHLAYALIQEARG